MDARPAASPTVALLAWSSIDSTAWLASALADVATVHLIVPDDVSDYVRPDLDARVQVWPFRMARRTQPRGLVRMSQELVDRLHSLEPDVIHMQQGHYAFNLALGRLGDVPLVLTVHEVLSRRRPRIAAHRAPQWPYRLAIRRARRVIVHGESLRPAVLREGADPGRVHVIPRAAPPIRAESGDASEPTVLFFGRVWPYKGLEYLVRAEPEISRRVPDARIVIAGHGEKLARYRRLMRHPESFEVHDRYLSREERDDLFRRASVVVLPYVDASTSAVIPVAYAHRKPVVVTSVGGLPGDVEDGRTGLVVPPRDPGALADAIARLLLDDGLRHELGEAGRRKLDTEAAPELIGRQALEIYAMARRAA